MPVLSASQAVYPLLRSLFLPNIRLSMLWKSNRVNWLCCGMREAHGKDSACPAERIRYHTRQGRTLSLVVWQLYNFSHSFSCILVHKFFPTPWKSSPQEIVFKPRCVPELIVWTRQQRALNGPGMPLLGKMGSLFCSPSPQSNFPDILHVYPSGLEGSVPCRWPFLWPLCLDMETLPAAFL